MLSQRATGRPARAGVLALASALLLATSPAAAAGSLRERNSLPEASAVAGPTDSVPLSTWFYLDFGAEGSVTARLALTSEVPVLLRVVDALCRGDRFYGRDNGYRILVTTDTVVDAACDDVPHRGSPRKAWLDPSYSHGSFLLQPGTHRISFRVIRSPFEGGDFAVRFDPQPVE